MITLSEVEQYYQSKLSTLYSQEEIKQIFLITLEKTAHIPIDQYSIKKSEAINEDIKAQMIAVADELSTGRPIQHILGEAPFYGSTFYVSADTLIPRPETEELVHLILQRQQNEQGLRIIDLGTGTGCIAITLAKKMKQPNVWAMDISDKALLIAKANAEKQQQAIHFVQGDMLAWDNIFDTEQKFDIVVSNPPYITPDEKKDMHVNVLDFEPETALFVPSEAPLLFYDHIADFALEHLAENGWLYIEINQYLSAETASLLREKGFCHIEIHKDINGVDRMISAQRID